MQADIEIETEGGARKPRRFVVDGHDLSKYCNSVEVTFSVGGFPIIRPTLMGRDISISHHVEDDNTGD
jgi:hypothetical protein